MGTIALFSRLDVSHSLASTDRPSLHAPSTLDISTFPSSSLSWLDRLSASRKVFTTFPLHFTCFLSIHRRPHGHPWFPSRRRRGRRGRRGEVVMRMRVRMEARSDSCYLGRKERRIAKR